jgi:hypothetical protein
MYVFAIAAFVSSLVVTLVAWTVAGGSRAMGE